MVVQFEWDPEKAEINRQKHRVSFEMARVFADPFALVVQDRIVSGEYRWQTLGCVEGCLILLVAHTVGQFEHGTEVIRIISARRATATERMRYEQDRTR